MSFFQNFNTGGGLVSPENYSAHMVKHQADVFRRQGSPITATVLEAVVSRFLKGGDKEIGELFSCLDEDIIDEIEDSFYKNLN